MIKKILLAMVLTLTSPMAIASGPYDGIWHTEGLGYFTLNENNKTVVLVSLPTDETPWEAATGIRDGDTIQMESIVSQVYTVFEIIFLSDTVFKVRIESCEPITPDYDCVVSEGLIFHSKKVF